MTKKKTTYTAKLDSKLVDRLLKHYGKATFQNLFLAMVEELEANLPLNKKPTENPRYIILHSEDVPLTGSIVDPGDIWRECDNNDFLVDAESVEDVVTTMITELGEYPPEVYRLERVAYDVAEQEVVTNQEEGCHL